MELEYLSDVKGKRVCVLGSGDNQVVFALAGLGASVTSVDIAQGQLDVGSRRAQELGLSVSFVRADVTDLAEFADGHFDIVYTGGHVAVWVSNLKHFYSEAARVLRVDGYLIVAEYHPFRRIWKDSSERLEVGVSYYERGPFTFDSNDHILRSEPGDLRSYEFHWRVSDYVNAICQAGCQVLTTDEFGEDVADWEGAPMQGLPEFLLIVSQKR